MPNNATACENWLRLRQRLLSEGYVQTTLTNFERADIAAGLIVTVALVVCAAVLGLALSAGTFGERTVVSSALSGRRSDDE